MIYIVRHGQTVWNLHERKQGRKDSPLTLRGLSQAYGAAEALQKEPIDASKTRFITSPLPRCWQFATIVTEICDWNELLTSEDLLCEHSFGLWEGLNESEIEILYPGALEKRRKDWWSYQVPGGESYELVYKRVEEFFLKHSESENLVLFTHEMVSKMIRKKLLGLPTDSALALNHPQNKIYKISPHEISELVITERGLA